MRKTLLFVVFYILTASLNAQNVRNQMRHDKRLSAGNFMAYRTPQEQLTPAPAGTHPFYISHYGRHGSRYHSKIRNYQEPWKILKKADSLNQLTPLGRDVLQRVTRIYQEGMDRWGELTPVGADQQRQIVRRMVERFPEVFEGDATVNAKSSIFSRAILSMENALIQLLTIRPQLQVTHNASHSDMYYLDAQDDWTRVHHPDSLEKAVFDAYVNRRNTDQQVIARLFKDKRYVSKHINVPDLADLLFKLAANQQNTLLRNEVTLYDLFKGDEAYINWQKDNAWWYLNYGSCLLNGGRRPMIQHRLLKKIIEEADSCIKNEKGYVHLRYGDETVLMPLLCLINVNGYGLATNDLESLERKGWVNYRAIPMSANIQLVFYHRYAGDPEPLFKVLLNEEEATLPLPTKNPPYYKWSDFRQYCAQIVKETKSITVR